VRDPSERQVSHLLTWASWQVKRRPKENPRACEYTEVKGETNGKPTPKKAKINKEPRGFELAKEHRARKAAEKKRGIKRWSRSMIEFINISSLGGKGMIRKKKKRSTVNWYNEPTESEGEETKKMTT